MPPKTIMARFGVTFQEDMRQKSRNFQPLLIFSATLISVLVVSYMAHNFFSSSSGKNPSHSASQPGISADLNYTTFAITEKLREVPPLDLALDQVHRREQKEGWKGGLLSHRSRGNHEDRHWALVSIYIEHIETYIYLTSYEYVYICIHVFVKKHNKRHHTHTPMRFFIPSNSHCQYRHITSLYAT